MELLLKKQQVAGGEKNTANHCVAAVLLRRYELAMEAKLLCLVTVLISFSVSAHNCPKRGKGWWLRQDIVPPCYQAGAAFANFPSPSINRTFVMFKSIIMLQLLWYFNTNRCERGGCRRPHSGESQKWPFGQRS